MIESYKNFLLEQMNDEIECVKALMTPPINIHSDFIDDEYFTVMEDKYEVYLIILNSYKDGTYKLQVEIYDYKRVRKFSLKDVIAPKTWKKLLKRGLYMSLYSGKNNNNGYFSIQRLTKCISENILGLQIDHIDSNSLNNNFDNLKALEVTEHQDKTWKTRKERRKKYEEIYITL